MRPARIRADLLTRRDADGLRRLGGHLLALAASALLVARSGDLPGSLPAQAMHGWVLVFLFAPLHETVHRTAFASKWINQSLAAVCGFLLLLPAGYFRAFHLQHHRFTQDPRHDPELAGPRPATLAGYLLHVSGLPYWYDRLATLVRHAGGATNESFLTATGHRRVVREARVHLGLYALLGGLSAGAGSAMVLLDYWLVPALLGMPLLRAFLLAEHFGCEATSDMARNSRTTHSNAVLRFLGWNMNYHTTHHCHPAVPFHALAAAHGELAPVVAVQCPGYVTFHRQVLDRFRSQ